MKPRIFNRTLFIALLLSSNLLFGKEARICGKIENFSQNKIKIEIYRTDAIWLDAKSWIYEIKISHDGSFNCIIEDIEHFMFESKLDFGKKDLYLSIAPNDSIFISVDYNHFSNVKFSGSNANKNYFMNNFLQSNFNKNPVIDYNWLKNNLQRLNDDTKRFDIKLSSKEYIKQYLYLYYFHNLFTSRFSDYNNKIQALDTFDINNENIAWHYLYYSNISSYINFKENRDLNMSTARGLENDFKLSEKYLTGTIKENYKAYIIGYAIMVSEKEIRKSEKGKKIIKDFLENCKNDYLKDNLTELLINKRII